MLWGRCAGSFSRQRRTNDSTTSGTDATSGADSSGSGLDATQGADSANLDAATGGVESGKADAVAPADSGGKADAQASPDSSGGADASGADAATEAAPPTCGGGTAQSSDVSIEVSSLEQHITGFGVSSAWAGGFNNASDPEYLWSTTTGAGLTLLRIRYGDGLTIAKAAVGYGVTVWMTVWGTGSGGAPGGTDTTTETNPNGCTNGSMPVLTNPQDLANTLSSWVQNAKSEGVPLYAVSGANEPDSCGINQTTSYSPAELTTWITYLGPAMSALGVKVMAPETQNACGFTGYFSSIQSNTTAWSDVGVFASHEYGCGTLPSEPSIAAANKEYWETEVDTGTASSDSTGDGIASALLMATTIHNDLTKANLNAWHLWWLYEGSGAGGSLYDTTTKVWTKRLWVLGNFSRFVRPGYNRVSTSGTVPSGVQISAYINPKNNALSIVAINTNTSSTNVSFYISSNAPCSLTPYETSAANSLGQLSPVTVSNSRVTVTLTAQSVTTFVGTP